MVFFATLISRIFEPIVVLFVLFIVSGFQVGLSEIEQTWFVAYITALFAMVGIIRLWMVRRWKLDWDIVERQKRIRPLLIILVIVLMNAFVIGQWYNEKLSRLFYLFVLWLFGFFLVTLKYKISGHVGIITLAAMFWRPALLFIPAVAWSRIVLKRHTLTEVILGFVYSFVLYETWKSIFR